MLDYGKFVSNFASESQEAKSANPNAHQLMEKQNVVHPYSGISLFSHKKEWHFDTGYSVDES